VERKGVHVLASSLTNDDAVADLAPLPGQLRCGLDGGLVVRVGFRGRVLSTTEHSLVVQSEKERALRRTSGALQAEQVFFEHDGQVTVLFAPFAEPRNFEQALLVQ
jgi:hypothetical protein